MEEAKEIWNLVQKINADIKNSAFCLDHNFQNYVENNLYDYMIKDEGLITKTRKLFMDGHHAEAVEKAYKYLNNVVKKICKQYKKGGLDGASLMNHAFSPNAPIIRLNSLLNDSEKDEQLGFMNIFSGCMIGIRNPRAHEHDWEDTESNALYMISFADFLLNKIHNAIIVDA